MKLLHAMALLTLCAAQEHAESNPRAPLGSPEPPPRDPPPRDLPPSPAELVSDPSGWRLTSAIRPRPWRAPRPPPPRYVCPHCNATSNTPKRCRPCGVKMRRARRFA